MGKKNLTDEPVPFLDSAYGYKEKFENLEIFRGKAAGEISPPEPPACFLGAWYRKAFSSKDHWLGIEGVIELGEFFSDPKRYGFDPRMDIKRDLDNASVYMGGAALSESDAGLGMNIGYLTGDTSCELDYSSPRVAFLPFWRYIYNSVSDKNNSVVRNSINSWNNVSPKALQYYYFPGDVLRMAVYSPMPDYLQLSIRVIQKSRIEKYAKIRDGYGLKNNSPSDFFSPVFFSAGHGRGKAEFKRVNSIDQYANEGKNAIMTAAHITSVWREVYLYRNINGVLYKLPFTQDRQSSMKCPDENAVFVTPFTDGYGGETVTIKPIAKQNTLSEY